VEIGGHRDDAVEIKKEGIEERQIDSGRHD
jgi:hypothetical protein